MLDGDDNRVTVTVLIENDRFAHRITFEQTPEATVDEVYENMHIVGYDFKEPKLEQTVIRIRPGAGRSSVFLDKTQADATDPKIQDLFLGNAFSHTPVANGYLQSVIDRLMGRTDE